MVDVVSLKKPGYIPEMKIAGIEHINPHIKASDKKHCRTIMVTYTLKIVLFSEVQDCLKDLTYWAGLWGRT